MAEKKLYLIYGPPGSGKTALAEQLAQYYSLELISWGKIIKSNKAATKVNQMRDDTERAKRIKSIINNRLTKCSQKENNGIVLEGYPHNDVEARDLIEILRKLQNIELEALIVINTTLPQIVERYRKSDQNIDVEVIKENFYTTFKATDHAISKLQPYSNMFFFVADEPDPMMVFANTLVKINQQTRADHKIYERKASAKLPTRFGTFTITAYISKVDFTYHLALTKGIVRNKQGVLTRIHSSCITGDIFGSYKCDCREQLHNSLKRINQNDEGILIYLFQEGRGINIINKILAYDLQDHGRDTVEANLELGLPAEMRQYKVAQEILKDQEIQSIRLLTNNPDKVRKLSSLGVIIEERVPIEIEPCELNQHYLKTKKDKMNHKLRHV